MLINRNWSVNITSKNRYEFTGINKLVIDHLNQKKISNPIIIDVGCSTGIALKKTFEAMKRSSYNPYTIGIDQSKYVKSKAEGNLSRFINRDALDVDDLENTADVVICSKAAIYILGAKRSAIIRKCASFLKRDGILITDVDCFPPRTIAENTYRFLRAQWYSIPSIDCFKHGVTNITFECERRANTIIKGDVFKMTKNEATSYADEIIRGWQKRSPEWKKWWQFRILMLGLAFSSW